MKVFIRLALRMGVQKKREVLTDHEYVIRLFVDDFEPAHRLPRSRIGEPERELRHFIWTRSWRLDCQIERILENVRNTFDQSHAASCTRTRPKRTDIGVHGTVEGSVDVAVEPVGVSRGER